jgi:hypothetical protein
VDGFLPFRRRMSTKFWVSKNFWQKTAAEEICFEESFRLFDGRGQEAGFFATIRSLRDNFRMTSGFCWSKRMRYFRNAKKEVVCKFTFGMLLAIVECTSLLTISIGEVTCWLETFVFMGVVLASIQS